MGIPFQVHDGSGALQDSPDWSACHILPQLIDTPPATCLQNRTLSYILRYKSWNVAGNGQNQYMIKYSVVVAG
jgi:hypothetical protein